MLGKTVFEGDSSKGNSFLIRYPTMDDVQAMQNFINELSREQTFITYQGEQVTLEAEKEYLNKQLKRIDENKTVQLLVFSKDKLIGLCTVDLAERTSSHQGVLGIMVVKDFRGEGIGRKLMETALLEAKKNLGGLKLVTLGVFGCNISARGMYEKLGFKEYGSLPKGVLYKGQYVDHVYMYKEV